MGELGHVKAKDLVDYTATTPGSRGVYEPLYACSPVSRLSLLQSLSQASSISFTLVAPCLVTFGSLQVSIQTLLTPAHITRSS